MYRIRHQILKSLSQTLTEGINELGEKYQAVQMLPELQKVYPDQLKPEIISVRFYQTERACYLETTIDEYKEEGIDPENKNPEVPYEEYSRVNYRIHRESLAFISEDDDLAYHPGKPVLENAADFLWEMDPYSLINCTHLFTKEAEKKIAEEYAEEYAKEEEYQDSIEPPDYEPEEITITGESLNHPNSNKAPRDYYLPHTDLAWLSINEEESNILLYQNDKHLDSHKPVLPDNAPSFVVLETDGPYGNERYTRIRLPNKRIKQIRVKTSEAIYIEYGLPAKYEYLIELTTGKRLIVEGEFGEDSESGFGLPEYWYYEHKIRVE